MRHEPTSNWLIETRRQLAGLGLPPDWSEENIAAPGLRATRLADCALRLLADLDLRPDLLLPCPEGGVCMAFGTAGRYADVQFLNSGEVIATCSADRSTPEVHPAADDLRTTFQSIRAFLVD
ncbi:MAG TPA: hypothetical protein VF789_24860 [Thermoanaerobaculia bacterium]